MKYLYIRKRNKYAKFSKGEIISKFYDNEDSLFVIATGICDENHFEGIVLCWHDSLNWQKDKCEFVSNGVLEKEWNTHYGWIASNLKFDFRFNGVELQFKPGEIVKSKKDGSIVLISNENNSLYTFSGVVLVSDVLERGDKNDNFFKHNFEQFTGEFTIENE